MLDTLNVYKVNQDKYLELATDKKKALDLCFNPSGEKHILDKTEESKLPWETTQRYPSVYSQVAPEDFEDFLNGLKRRLFMSTLEMIYGFHKHAWAKITVTTNLKKVYLENNKFSPSELEFIEEMISSVNAKASQQVSMFDLVIIYIETSIGRDVLDSKIKSDPLQASHTVVDGRSERVIFESGQSKWASK